MQNTMYFKGSREDNYMIRSEKRPSSGRTSPRGPRRPRQGWYAALTILLLILLWPVGLVLLWRKRLEWSGGVKFFLTLLSLVALFLALGAALIYPFRDERARSVQARVSEFIDQADQRLRQAPENWRAVSENAREIGAAAGNHALGRFLDIIASPTPEPTPVPPLTLRRSGGDLSPALALLNRPTPTPDATFTPEPTETPAPTPNPTEEGSADATPAPEDGEAAQPTANSLDRPTPTLDPSLGLSGSNTPVPPRTAAPTPEETPAPTPTAEPEITEEPTPSPSPTPEPTPVPAPQPVGEALVWHTSDGRFYHKGPRCGTMANASSHSLSDAVAAGKTTCPYCKPIDARWLREENVVYASADDSRWHIRFDCAALTGGWTPMTLEDARAGESLAPCDACGAIHYAQGVPDWAADATPQPEEATDEPRSEEEIPVEEGLNLSEVRNGDELVYYVDNVSHYHRFNTCASSTILTFVPHKLMDALLEGKVPCPVCNPPLPVTQ